MSTPISSETIPSPKACNPSSSVDDGLRSAQGIRWLLLAGALVVAVSVVRLVAAEWGSLGPNARFLSLVLGALTIYTIGDFTRHRLRLPVAGSAFLFLFTALVPLLSWGAAQQRLIEAPLGWPCLVVGLGTLLSASSRVLRRVLDYRGSIYPATVGLFLLAMPALPYFEARQGDTNLFFIVTAIGLGLLLRSCSLHINRFFFHRDRVSGVDRPVHWLPFGLLVLIYGASMSLLESFSTHLALPLAFVALALIDAGEEYYQALIRATGHQPDRWPRRSLAILALGFAALAASLAMAPFDAGHSSLALVASIVTLRLLAWAWRYQSVVAHTGGLLAGIVAWHALPALIPEPIRHLFEVAISWLGINPRDPAAVSLASVWLVAALLGLAWALRHRLTPAMARAHSTILCLQTSLALLISVQDTDAARVVAPISALLLLGGLFLTRWKMLIPVLYQALLTAGLAWIWHPAPDVLWIGQAALLIGVVNVFFLGGGLLILQRRSQTSDSRALRAWITWPVLAFSSLLLPPALVLIDIHSGVSGLLLLVMAETCLLGAVMLRKVWPYPVASLCLVVGLHCLVGAIPGASTGAYSIVSQGLMVLFWILSRYLAKRGDVDVVGLRLGTRIASVACAFSGLLWPVIAFAWGNLPGVEPLHLALLGGLLIAEELRSGRRPEPLTGDTGAAAVSSGWQLETGLALLMVWVPIQAAGVATPMTSWMLTAIGWLALAVAGRAAAEVFERRGLERHSRDTASGAELGDPGLVRTLLVAAMTCAALGGAAAIHATTLGGSPWLPILPAFLASLFFVFMAAHGRFTRLSASLATSYFVLSSSVLLARLPTFGRELYCLGPGLALLGLSVLLRREVDERWRHRLFTAGAACLYAMPVLGLLEALSWGWQIVLLLLAIAFGSASFWLRSRSLLIVSTAALMINLTCFLIRLRQTEPLLLWVAGIVFGLSLMALAGILEHRREVLLQRIRIWGHELSSWA